LFDRFQAQVLPFVELKNVIPLSWPETIGY
jgi:hypothetical protein